MIDLFLSHLGINILYRLVHDLCTKRDEWNSPVMPELEPVLQYDARNRDEDILQLS